MKLKFSCLRCLDECKRVFPEYSDLESLDLRDSYCYDYTCPNGHETNYVIGNPRYEILYDFGVSAYLDGYYREAVLDFAAALEKFYEHAVFMMLGTDASNESRKAFWNQIRKQSERQYGAYMAIYLAKYGEMPALPSNSQIQFRNDVTHKGYFPTEEETKNYAEFVANYIVAISKKFPNDIKSHFAGMFPAVVEMLEQPEIRVSHKIYTVITRLYSGIPFDDAIAQFKETFDLYYGK